jgi:hypothetical protein
MNRAISGKVIVSILVRTFRQLAEELDREAVALTHARRRAWQLASRHAKSLTQKLVAYAVPPPGANGRCWFAQRTFALMLGNGRFRRIVLKKSALAPGSVR